MARILFLGSFISSPGRFLFPSFVTLVEDIASSRVVSLSNSLTRRRWKSSLIHDMLSCRYSEIISMVSSHLQITSVSKLDDPMRIKLPANPIKSTASFLRMLRNDFLTCPRINYPHLFRHVQLFLIFQAYSTL